MSDTLLASAFERYCLVSKQLRRKTGNVPGPLESRRRLGKRQIGGGLNVVQSAPSLPAWALANTSDLSKWHWEPATPAAVRDEKLEQARLTEAALPAWLREWTPPDFEEPTLQPAGIHNATDQAAHSILEELDSFRSSVLADLYADAGPRLTEICQRLEMQLSLGQAADKELGSALRDVLEALGAQPKPVADISGPSVTLYSAVINGIKASRVSKPSDFSPSFWGNLLVPMAKLPANDDLCNIFELFMGTLPTQYYNPLSNKILSVLETFYSSWSGTDGWDPVMVTSCLETATESHRRCQNLVAEANDCVASNPALAKSLLQQANEAHQACYNAIYSATNAISSHRRQVQAVSRALSQMDRTRKFFTLANRRLLSRTLLSPEASHRLRYNWLSVLAQLPRTNQDFMLEAHRTLFSESMMDLPLTDADICQLLIDHWKSRGRLTDPQRFGLAFESLCMGRESASIAALAYTVFREETGRRWLIDGLCEFLKPLGWLAGLPGSFQKLGELEQLPVRLLERVAAASDDHLVAIDLHRAYVGHLSRPDASDWDPRTWSKYLDAIFIDPNVSPARIWKILGIEFSEDSVRRCEPRPRKQRCSHGKYIAPIVADLAVRFAYADHIRNRVAFRHVSQCVVFLEAYTKEVPVVVLQALYHVVSRDLAEGRPGKTARLQYFLRIVERQYGGREAKECALLLQQWRHLMLRMNQAAAIR